MAIKRMNIIALLSVMLALAASVHETEAGHGCPVDNAQCQDYCGQQGCRVGYCGHFAWIQCICRKCGDEWGYYDKVHYNPDKRVNQTELDSLKLNHSEPLILTDNNNNQDLQQQQQKPKPKHATLTTLLIPDLSDSSKLDLNDVPDENSEKFLDFLAKNHEKLVEATSQNSRNAEKMVTIDLSDEARQTTTTLAPPTEEAPEETVEIQISSSNNNNNNNGNLSVNKRDSDEDDEMLEATDGEQAAAAAANAPPTLASSPGGSVTRLLRMAVAERASEEIERRRR